MSVLPSFNLKEFCWSYTWSSAYVKEKLSFARGLSLESSADSYCFYVPLLQLVPYLFFHYQSPSSSLCPVFDALSSKIYEVLFINPTINAFAFVDFKIYHRFWLTYSDGFHRPGFSK